ncbi:MAG: TRAP transporter permease [Rhodospirillales bacterium]|nr:TRAP transporter permease [Rhodospirillales bacterium]
MAEEKPIDRAALERLVEETDVGGRKPRPAIARLLMGVALAWSLFQLWYASPLPYVFGVFILNDTEARAIHLAFALFLCFTYFPALKRSPRRYIPLGDWVFAIAGACASAYLFVFYRDLAERPGLPTTVDLVVSGVGLVCLLEAVRRSVGPALAIIALVFIGYIFGGPYLPEMIAHKGASFGRAMSQLWLTTEGVFGVALGVSTSIVFLFVLFGNLLEKAGAGNYFIKLSFSLLGHMRGGPAKAGVVSSGLTGMISGSSIANVVTTGTFTIPLMKRVGYHPVKAGAIECAAGVNGQIMPPVMGAAAFLIAEYVGIPYAEVVKHAFLPAIITYLALFYIVDIEAVKAGMKGLPRERRPGTLPPLFSFLLGFSGFVILCGLVYYGIGWIRDVFGPAATWIIVGGLLVAYVGLVWHRARYPDLELDDPTAAVVKLPEFAPTANTGLHYLLPVGLLIWCLMVEALSPALSAFWATVLLTFILLTQRPLTALFRGERDLAGPFRLGVRELFEGLVAGGRNMAGVGIATAAAGIIVGTVSLTGIGLVMTELVDFLSGGNLIVMLALTAVICLILGMGMPTTASYVVVATLMAPVIVQLAGENDLAVPLVAVHLFVFYFGLMADVTPPVGLAAFAAAAISGADPFKTGVQGFRYEIRTGLLPFVFIFNNELLLIDIENVGQFILVVAASLLAMMLFVSATQQWLLVKNRLWETAALLLVCFTLFRPGYWMDMIYPPFERLAPTRAEEVAGTLKPGDFLRLRLEGDTLSGDTVERVVKLPLGKGDTARERLRAAGLTLATLGDEVIVQQAAFRSTAAKLGIENGMKVTAVEVPADRPAKHWLYLPALALLGLVVLAQRARRARAGAAPAPA